uniref:Protein-serine O-palmitoleoyltransferase porcupine n=1 Tax=Rhabditophanes sp. KR3021 TaxID=114890 RepID=A0AC35UIC7_9BILA
MSFFYLIICFIAFKLNSIFVHLASGVLGICALHWIFAKDHIINIHLLFFVISYQATNFREYHKLLPLAINIFVMVMFQLSFDAQFYTTIRGSLMIMAMKMSTFQITPLDGIVNAFSYAFSPDHIDTYKRKSNYDVLTPISFCTTSLVYLVMSSCVYPFLSASYNVEYAYVTAQTFRFSHYFVNDLSFALASIAGVKPLTGNSWTLKTEFPRSMKDVSYYWNIGMSHFFKSTIAVFTISSALHGFNFQLTAVLLSMGVYAMVEIKLRKKLASKFDCCCLCKRCNTDCKHTYKTYQVRSLVLNSMFVCLNMYHLMYLGAPFDNSAADTGYSFTHTLHIFGSKFKFGSPIIVAIQYFITLLI